MITAERKVHPMDTLEYRRIITELDRQLDEAKKAAEKKQRKEELEQRIKLRSHWLSSFEAKRAEFQKYGLKPPIDLDAKITEINAEKADYERQLADIDAPPPVPQEPPKLSAADNAELLPLIDEVTKTPVGGMVHEERWTLFEIWSIRWRIIAERAGNELANTDSGLRMCFARIREKMKDPAHQAGWFIDALDKEAVGDWPLQLRTAQDKLAKLVEERKRAEAAEQAIRDLTDHVAQFTQPGKNGDDRMLRHHARQAAKFEHLRDEVAEMLLPLRPKLEDEFAFLWDDGKGEEEKEPEQPKKLTNQEIVARILKRMKSKALIGECHGPADKICKGFPDHDKGRAKEAVELLCKAGVLRKKPTLIGARLSIEPKFVSTVDAVVWNKKTNIPALDEWMKEGANGEKG